MPLKSYGVLKGKAIEVRLGAGSSPHYQVRIKVDGVSYTREQARHPGWTIVF